jgi:hypothetical protein
MENRLRAAQALARRLVPEEPNLPQWPNSILDQLPPVLGPSDWSDGLLNMTVDSTAAWYFDRQ